MDLRGDTPMRRLVLIVLAVLLSTRVAAQDVVIDNPWVHVLRIKQAPHAMLPVHEHPATVVVYLTDAQQRITGAGGAKTEMSHKSGDVTWFDAQRHAEENLSDHPLEMVVIELKPGAPKVVAQPITLDPVKLDPDNHLVPFENGRVRVLRTILPPHLKSPSHQHPPYVVVYLTDLHTTMAMADGRVIDNPRRPGEIAWRDALTHVTENIGERVAMEIQVELK